MPGEMFYWLLNMSLTASLTGLIVLLIRAAGLPRRVTVLLWVVPFARMGLPVGLSSRVSLFTLLSRFLKTPEVFSVPSARISLSMTNCVQAADSYFPLVYRAERVERLFGVAGTVWLTVFLLVLSAIFILYVSGVRAAGRALPLRGRIFCSQTAEFSAVYGIFRPRIVLAAADRRADLRYILLHEKTHVRRGDNFWRLAAFCIAAAHWFNPLAWVFLKLFLADLELSCDEMVLSRLGPGHVKAYASALLAAGARRAPLACAFGGAKLRRRIENILSYRRLTALALAGSSALVAAVLYILLTNAG